MATAKTGDTVAIHYTGTLEDGTEFDSSQGRDPLEFTLGKGMVIPGFEQAVEGMEPGEKKTVTIECENAYGERNDEAVANIPLDQLPEDLSPEVGMTLEVRDPEGNAHLVVIIALDEKSVTLDGNHPLAGKDLTFAIELVKVGE